MLNKATMPHPVVSPSRPTAMLACLILLCPLLFGCRGGDTSTQPSGSSATGETGKTQPEITLLAAASTTNAVDEIARLFEQSHPDTKVKISTGPSNGLAQQIMAGAPADIFLSANTKWADAVADDGLAAETVELLTNRMVLIVPKGNAAGVTQPRDLIGEKVLLVAIAGENVPAGIYAEQALRNLNLLDQLQEGKKLARGSDVRITLAYVERGEADAGIVYATDARISDQVEVIVELDPQSYDPVVYPVVLLKRATDSAAARDFFRFLQSADAQAVFERYGFSPLPARP